MASGRKLFYPLKPYCYIDIQTSLQRMLLKTDFIENCDKWRARTVTEGTLADVYDGKVWKEFLHYSGKPFLAEPFSFAFLINIDWFQPYKHLSYSVGAIYLAVLNLPRSMQYRLENICLVGIIPGPREPELTVNSYIDLLQLWELTFV